MGFCRRCFHAPTGTVCFKYCRETNLPVSLTNLFLTQPQWTSVTLKSLNLLNIKRESVLSPTNSIFFFFSTGDAKSEDTANKEAGEEKPEEDNDYHRSDEQVSLTDDNICSLFPASGAFSSGSLSSTLLHFRKAHPPPLALRYRPLFWHNLNPRTSLSTVFFNSRYFLLKRKSLWKLLTAKSEDNSSHRGHYGVHGTGKNRKPKHNPILCFISTETDLRRYLLC